MAMNPLPPQAYTKDTLLKAYTWLQNQNDSIKGLALTPDILVSLFLKAKMNGEESLERPSIQNFKAELKNLAGLMGEFESKTERPTANPTAPTNPSIRPMERPSFAAGATTSESPMTERPPEPARMSPDFELDFRSQTMIREVKNEFNLGSDLEALRLLISIGFKRMKNLE